MDYIDTVIKNVHSFYFIIAFSILTVFGLPWIAIRKKIKQADMRRRWSCLIFSLAFTPGIFGGDKGGFAAPVIYLIPYYSESFWIVVGLGSIVIIWGLFYVTSSICSSCLTRSLKKNK